VLLLALLGGGGAAAWAWSQQQYYVGAADQRVAIYRGLPQDVGPIKTSRLYRNEDIPLEDLPAYQRERVRSEIPASGLRDAQRIVTNLREQADICRAASASPTPTSTPSGSPTTTTAKPAPAASGTASSTPSATTTTSPGGPSPTPSTPEQLGCGDGS
jgi:protein phosphatase